jgi:thiamine monophosphate synthase
VMKRFLNAACMRLWIPLTCAAACRNRWRSIFARGGADLIQVRAKGATAEEVRRLARAVLAVAHQAA